MRTVSVAILSLASLIFAWTRAHAKPPPPWILPRDRAVYLMEDDLVYARFLTLARSGTYQQINRNEHGSAEVDRGNWEQDATGTVRLHSSCRALRPRAVSSGPLSVTLTGDRAFDGLPTLLTAIQRCLAADEDVLFGAETLGELNKADAPPVHLDRAAVTFDRRDAMRLAARLEAALASERDATYLLEPVKTAPNAIFALQGSVFGPESYAGTQADGHAAAGSVAPFYFTRIDAKAFAREVGRLQPLHLPGGVQ